MLNQMFTLLNCDEDKLSRNVRFVSDTCLAWIDSDLFQRLMVRLYQIEVAVLIPKIRFHDKKKVCSFSCPSILSVTNMRLA